MDPTVRAWFDERSYRASDWPLDVLTEAKDATTVSVVLPALNEATTVGPIAGAVRHHLMQVARPLVDELVVIDSGSTDETASVAAGAGARVVHVDEALPQVPSVPGKGEALWRSLAATSGDVIVFVDADLLSFQPSHVAGLLAPLLTDSSTSVVKAMYERPLDAG